MSKYTMQLRYLCEMKAGYTESTGSYLTVIDKAYRKIIQPETRLFDTAYEPVLYKKILKHYYFDEIAHETAAKFIMRLNTKLDEILPYYNQLYASAALEFNPFYDVDYKREGNKEDNNTVDSTRTDNLQSKRTDNLANSTDSTTTSLYSDTPEGSLSGVNNETYLTTANKDIVDLNGTNTGTQTINNTGNQKNNDKIHNINEYFEHVYGKMGTADYSGLLIKFRETFLNIDMMIIDELRPLFMGVY